MIFKHGFWKPVIVNLKPILELETHDWDYKPMFVDLLFTWRAKFYTNISLKVKSRVIKRQIMKPMIELLKPMLESH